MQTNYYKFKHNLSLRAVGTSDHYTTFKILVFNVADVSESEENEGDGKSCVSNEGWWAHRKKG